MKKVFALVAALALVAAPLLLLGTVPVHAASDDLDWSWDSTSTSSSGDGVFAGMSLIFWCCCCAVSMIIPLAIAFLVYKDAQKSNVDNPMLWAVIVFFTGLIGLLVYFLVAKKKE